MNKSLRFRTYWLLFLISLIPLIALLFPGIPFTHDGRDHVARIASFYASLSEGNLIPRWASNLNWGYGHPILMFLYPFSSYLGSLFHLLGFSFVDSTKLVFASVYVGSILAMYFWIREQWDEYAGVVAAVLYGWAPYRFVDLYVRGAIGEHAAFLFPPLMCFFILRLSRLLSQESWAKPARRLFAFYVIGLSLATGGLILSHNALALLFLPTVCIYVFYLFITAKEKNYTFLGTVLSCIGMGFGLSAFFWAPAFFEGKYTLRDKVTLGTVNGNFVPVSWFFYSPWNYGAGVQFTKQIGLVHWLGIGSLAVLYKKMSKSLKILSVCLGAIFLLSLFMMTKSSQGIWDAVSLLQKFQFPWRILSLSVFVASVMGALSIHALFQTKNPSVYVKVLIVLVAIGITFPMWKPKAYLEKPESFYTGIYDSTTDTGESSPIWSIRFMEHRPDGPVFVDQGKATVHVGKRNTTQRHYTIQASLPSRIIENTLYFPGWQVFVDGSLVPIEYQDVLYRGLITYRIPAGTHTVAVVFGDTKLRTYSSFVTVGTGIFLCLFWLYIMYFYKKGRHV